jgi:hypothetical protein
MENKKNGAVHKTAILVTPEKQQIIKEIPGLDNSKMEVEHRFGIVVDGLQQNGTIFWSKENSSTFLLA